MQSAEEGEHEGTERVDATGCVPPEANTENTEHAKGSMATGRLGKGSVGCKNESQVGRVKSRRRARRGRNGAKERGQSVGKREKHTKRRHKSRPWRAGGVI